VVPNTPSNDHNSKKRKADALQILQLKAKSYGVPCKVFGKEIEAILDTGATISAVSKRHVPDDKMKRCDAIPLQIGSGEFIYSLGSADLILQFGSKVLKLNAVVVDTTAFSAVLGTDFTESESFGRLLTRPPRIIIDGEEFPISSSEGGHMEIKRIFRLFRTESYTLVENIKSKVLRELGISRRSIFIDMFANHANFQEPLYLTKGNSSFRYNWSKLVKEEQCDYLWANPPFSSLDKVVTKLCLESTRMILVHPNWQNQYFSRLLDSITVKRVMVCHGTPVYVADKCKKALPAPAWDTIVSVVDTFQCQVPSELLDPKIVRWLQRTSKNWGMAELKHEMKKYPKNDVPLEVEESIQTDVVPILVPNTPQVSQVVEQVVQEVVPILPPKEKVESWLEEVSHDPCFTKLSDHEMLSYMADLTKEIEKEWDLFSSI
jgi:hypothetical protein